MGILSSLFGVGFRNPSQDRWDSIIATIHSRLAEDRKTFWNASVQILRMLPDTSIASPNMRDSMELSITVFQLLLGSSLADARNYFPAASCEAFACALYAPTCKYGSDAECSKYL